MRGHVRGVLVGRWADHCERRWGAPSVALVRARAGVSRDELPDEPLAKGWYPLSAQLAVTQAMVDLFLDGDRARLQPLVVADALGDVGRLQRLALRGLGPQRAYARVAELYGKVLDVGQVKAEYLPRGCRIQLTDAAVFAEPLWQDLQVWAHAAALELLQRGGGRVAGRATSDGFELEVGW